jgi:hypothetical protein
MISSQFQLSLTNKKAWQLFSARLFYQSISASTSSQKHAQGSAAGGVAQAADRFFLFFFPNTLNRISHYN